jgi:ABC-type multidrug transport system ATPase subunit
MALDHRDDLDVGLGARFGTLPIIEVTDVGRRFGDAEALGSVSLSVHPGEIHALLGPNGAGKTTLMRILTGLLERDGGDVRVFGRSIDDVPLRDYRRAFGFIPSGDRSFYLRLSGIENLLFFGRLAGMNKARARARASACLEDVGLGDVGKKMVGLYSHGMQKRLAVARALLMDPSLLYIDEATHDLDPGGAHRVRELVRTKAGQDGGVLWATQRLDEIRGFADRVTLLHKGLVRFAGTVDELMAMVTIDRYALDLDGGERSAADVTGLARSAIGEMGSIAPKPGSEGRHYELAIGAGASIGRIVWALEQVGLRVRSCREERSGIESAFLHLTEATE